MNHPSNPLLFLGKFVKVIIDRPLGSRHPVHGFNYPVNYGFIPNTLSGDGEPLDAYVLRVDKPLESFSGFCVAIITRLDDEDDKLVVLPEWDKNIEETEILQAVYFQEKFFESRIIRI